MPRTGRPVMPIGEHGSISVRTLREKKGSTPGLYRAEARVRGRDGKTRRVTAQGHTKTVATKALERKIDQLTSGDDTLNGNSTVRALGELWLPTVKKAPGTIDLYRQQLNAHIYPLIGEYRLYELTTSRVDRFLVDVTQPRTTQVIRKNGRPMTVEVGGPFAAKSCRVVLALMFALAIRYGALQSNPVREAEAPALPKSAVRAITVDELARLRENIAAWQEANLHRSQDLSDQVDLFAATGLRPGELLALTWDDVDLRSAPPTVAVTGTVRRTSSAGLHRQPFPKSEHGERILPLPGFAAAMLARRQLADDPARNPLRLVFPSAKGTVVDPGNFRRQWVAARGEEFEWVKPSSFRKSVATLLGRESGSEVASRQLGHSSDAITRRFYIERDIVAPNSAHILDLFAPAGKVSS